MSQQQSPTFARVGSTLRAIANYSAYALGLSIIVGTGSLFASFAGPYITSGGLIIIPTLCLVAFFKTIFLTRDLMNTFQALGEDRNIMQFKLFTRFLFNSIPASLIGLFWTIICVIIMFTPAFFPEPGPLFDWSNLPWSTSEVASLAGEIAICLMCIVLGLMFTPYSYKSWKLIDDYFVILRDPWSRDIGLLGMKKLLDAHKVTFGCIFLVFGAIGYQGAGFFFFIPSIAICALVAGVKYIQGLYRVATAFSRITTGQPQSLAQASFTSSRATSQQSIPSPASPSLQPAYLRYQPGQVVFNQGSAPLDPLGVPRQPDAMQATPERGNLVSGDSCITPVSTPASSISTTGSPGKCKYCFADLPSPNTGKCPGCGAALLSF